jgi:hypothetical protein
MGQRRQRANKRLALIACSTQPHAAKSMRGQSIVSVARSSISLVFLRSWMLQGAISTQAAGRRWYEASRVRAFPDARGVRRVRSQCSQSSNERSSRIGANTLAEYHMAVSFFSPNRFDADD